MSTVLIEGRRRLPVRTLRWVALVIWCVDCFLLGMLINELAR